MMPRVEHARPNPSKELIDRILGHPTARGRVELREEDRRFELDVLFDPAQVVVRRVE